MFTIEIVDLKDRPIELETNKNKYGATVGLLLHLMKALYNTGKFLMDYPI